MPDFSMYGPAASGSRLAEQDTINNFVKMANGRHNMALAGQEEEATAQAAQQRQFLAGLKTPDGMGGPGAGGALSDLPSFVAMQAFANGMPALGTKFAGEAVKMKAMEMTALERQAQETDRTAQTAIRQQQFLGQLFGAVKNEDDWNAANMTAAQMGLKTPTAGLPYDPAYAARMRDMSLKEADRQRIAIDAARVASQNALDRARESDLVVRQGLAAARVAEQNRHNEVTEKAGGRVAAGKPVGYPSEKSITDAERLILGSLPEGTTLDGSRDMAVQVAAEARALTQQIPGLDPAAAMQRALSAAKLRGDIQVGKPPGLFSKAKATFVGAGRMPETAIQATRDTKFIEDRYYITPKGMMQFKGGGFHPVEGAPMPARLPAEPAGSDTGDE